MHNGKSVTVNFIKFLVLSVTSTIWQQSLFIHITQTCNILRLFQECIVVCVISLEDVVVTPETVPYNQCREVRTVTTPSSNMDKITIAASAAICGTVVIAVIVFVAASRRRSRKLHTLQQHETKSGIPVGGLPVTCCTGMGPTPSPGGPLSSLATLSAFTTHKDWDQVSMYSNRSIPRPRVYHMERQGK